MKYVRVHFINNQNGIVLVKVTLTSIRNKLKVSRLKIIDVYFSFF